jgi:hypothetical protein
MSRYVEQLFTDRVGALVEENFTGVEAEWWWERRTGGGVSVCQELNPEKMVAEVAAALGRDVSEVRRTAIMTLGLEDFEPVVLTFDILGSAAVDEAADILAERSRTAEGLAEKIYRSLAESLQTERT